jgi:hypothetical protein
MPSRKQRQRRQKAFRHDYTLVDYDEEGNEVETSASELRAKRGKPDRPKAKSTSSGRSRRPGREPPIPSWRRSLRRGGMWGGVMFIVVVFFFKSTPVAGRVAIGLLYAVAFVPLTYWIDRVAYRSYLKRSGKSGT